MSQAHEQTPSPVHPPEADTLRLVELVDRTIANLAAKGVDAGDLRALYDVRDTLERLCARSAPPQVREERRRSEAVASDTIIARACACIELLVRAGHPLEQAAQTITRQLLASGINLPTKGGDVRGWRRMLEAHRSISRAQAPVETLEEYHRFKQQVAGIPANERANHILTERPWERRARRRDRRTI